MIRIECPHGRASHDSRRIDFDYYRRHHHRWFYTRSMKCHICGEKLMPEDERILHELTA